MTSPNQPPKAKARHLEMTGFSTNDLGKSNKQKDFPPNHDIFSRNTMNNSIIALNDKHRQHLLAEGFSSDQIDYLVSLGVRSLAQAEAIELGFRVWDAQAKAWVSDSGIYFPFTQDFGQLRVDHPVVVSGKPAKYLTPLGQQPQAYTPDGMRVITEGFKDAQAGCLHGGIPTSAIAGVSQYKIFPQGSLPGVVWLFDADGWANPSVFINLFNAARWTGGKVQLVPELPGYPKAGLCEFFSVGHGAEQYAALIASAMNPEDFLLQLPKHWGRLPVEKQEKAAKAVLKLAVKNCGEVVISKVETAIAKALGVKPQVITRMTKAVRVKVTRDQRFEGKPAIVVPKADRQSFIPHMSFPVAFDPSGKPKTPPESVARKYFEKRYARVLVYAEDIECWFLYQKKHPGVWSFIPATQVTKIIQKELDAAGLEYSASYCGNIQKMLQSSDLSREPIEPSRTLIPFRNGYLNQLTGEFLAHQPENFFTNSLMFDYNPNLTCPKTLEFLLSAQKGDQGGVEMLQAVLRAVITQADLQVFIDITGPGGSGKSTFGTLLSLMVPKTISTSLELLEKSQFESMNLRDAWLTILAEESGFSPKVSILKQLTGDDPVRGELKYLTRIIRFRYMGFLLRIANKPFNCPDMDYAIRRRQVPVIFRNTIAAAYRKQLISVSDTGVSGELADELPGLFNWALSMSEDRMRDLLTDPTTRAESQQNNRSVMMERSGLSSFVRDRLEIQPSDTPKLNPVQFGRAKQAQPGATQSFEFEDIYLYASYRAYTLTAGYKAKSLSEFQADLLEYLTNDLGHKHICMTRKATGYVLYGVTLRQANETPEVIEPAENPIIATVETTDTAMVNGDGKPLQMGDRIASKANPQTDVGSITAMDPVAGTVTMFICPDGNLATSRTKKFKPSEVQRISVN